MVNTYGLEKEENCLNDELPIENAQYSSIILFLVLYLSLTQESGVQDIPPLQGRGCLDFVR
jgi:hypothetical protein